MTTASVRDRSSPREHLLVTRPGFTQHLATELQLRFAVPLEALRAVDRQTLAIPVLASQSAGLAKAWQQLTQEGPAHTIFCRQIIPNAKCLHIDPQASTGVNEVVEAVTQLVRVATGRANRSSGRWTLHVHAVEDNACGKFANRLSGPINDRLRKNCPEFYNRLVSNEEFLVDPQKNDLVLQVWVSSPSLVYLSLASLATGVSPLLGGTYRAKTQTGAPSRSARKLSEAFWTMGIEPKGGQSAVDLGAAPGGWSLVLAQYGVKVFAIDHADLDKPLKKYIDSGQIVHLHENGLKYLPAEPVDWLCSDMVIGAKVAIEVLDGWLTKKLARHFVMNLKLPRVVNNQSDAQVGQVDSALSKTLQMVWNLFKKHSDHGHKWHFGLRHLYHDRNEITVYGFTTK